LPAPRQSASPSTSSFPGDCVSSTGMVTTAPCKRGGADTGKAMCLPFQQFGRTAAKSQSSLLSCCCGAEAARNGGSCGPSARCDQKVRGNANAQAAACSHASSISSSSSNSGADHLLYRSVRTECAVEIRSHNNRLQCFSGTHATSVRNRMASNRSNLVICCARTTVPSLSQPNDHARLLVTATHCRHPQNCRSEYKPVTAVRRLVHKQHSRGAPLEKNGAAL